MNNIQSVGTIALKNQPVPEVETKQSNVRKINFKAENDRFVRQGQPRYTQPAILQQQPQQDPYIRMLEKQQKEEKKKNFWNKFALFAGIGASLGMIALAIMHFRTIKGSSSESMKETVEKAKDNIIRNVEKEKSFEELLMPKELQKITEEIKVLLDRNAQLKRKGMTGNSAIMLYGEPGGGKNAYVYALTKHMQKTNPGTELIMMDVLKFNSKWLGETENNILGFTEGIIQRANKNPNKRFVVFMDEFDSISRKVTGNGAENAEKFQNAFKTAFNKLLEVDNIQIVAATNKASKDLPLNQLLDEAILNRFAKKVHVPLPTQEQLKNSFVKHYKTLPEDVIKPEMIDLDNKTLEKISEYIARENHHASFRDMNYILQRAREISEKEAQSRPIEMKDLVKATQEHAESMNWIDLLKV